MMTHSAQRPQVGESFETQKLLTIKNKILAVSAVHCRTEWPDTTAKGTVDTDVPRAIGYEPYELLDRPPDSAIRA